MNALIPLGVEYADPMRAIATGALARERVDANQTRNALAAAYAQHGAGAMQGDTNALAGIAALDPAVAQGLYTGVQDNRRADAGLDLRRQDTQSAIGARAAGVAQDATRTRNDTARLQLLEQETAAAMAKASREEKLAAITTIGTFLPEFEAAPDESAWDRLAQMSGQEDLVGQFGQRETALAMGRGALRGAQGDVPAGFQGLQLRAEAAGLVPGTPEYQAFMKEGDAPRTDITVNSGQPADPNAALYAKLDEAEGKRFSTILDTAPTVGRVAQQIGQLEGLLAAVPTGGGAALTAKLGEWGIETEGLSEAQALQAAIAAMVPGQRPPGSGTMSDADLALFKESIPRLINQPGGNAKIMTTMKAINSYDREIVRIASDVANRSMTPAEGRAAMTALANPLESWDPPSRDAGPRKVGSQEEFNALPSGTTFIAPDGTTRMKP